MTLVAIKIIANMTLDLKIRIEIVSLTKNDRTKSEKNGEA